MDKYKNKTDEFYKNIKKGQVDAKEFERYVYGGSYAQRNADENDKTESEIADQLKQYQHEKIGNQGR